MHAIAISSPVMVSMQSGGQEDIFEDACFKIDNDLLFR